MNYKQILKLIDTLISKTKCRELEWSSLINSYNLFKAPQTSFLESTPFLEVVSMPVTGSSYYTEIKNGYIFLIGYSTSQNNTFVKLYAQKNGADSASEYASTLPDSSTEEEIIELKRLYRLVETIVASCDDILEDLFSD